MATLTLTPQQASSLSAGRLRLVVVPMKRQPPKDIDALHGGEFSKRAPYECEDYETGHKLGLGFQDDDWKFYPSPFRPGERIGVKEKWAPSFKAPKCQVAYEADGRCYGIGGDGDGGYMRIFHGWLVDSKARGDQLGDTFGRSLYQPWRSARSMPEWAIRFRPLVSRVEVKRASEAPEEDSVAIIGNPAAGQWCWFLFLEE